MVSIARKGEPYSFIIPDGQAEKLGLAKGREYELLRVKQGFFVLSERTAGKAAIDQDKRIFSLLREKTLSERVEGKFEGFLNSGEKARLGALVKEGRVVRFKLSEKYRKAIYKTREEVERGRPEPRGQARPLEEKPVPEPGRQPEKKPEAGLGEQRIAGPETGKSEPAAGKKPSRQAQPAKEEETIRPIITPAIQKKAQPGAVPAKGVVQAATETTGEKEYSLEKDHFTVFSSEELARRLSQKLDKAIRRREILGTKSFDGEYFVIKTALYEKHSPAVLRLIKENSPITVDALSEKLRLDKKLISAICEFLKEEGEITERRKDVYRYI